MLPPALPAEYAVSAPAFTRFGLPARSAEYMMLIARTNRTTIALSSTQPCRALPANRPNMYVSPLGITRIASIWMKFVNGDGFSNG